MAKKSKTEQPDIGLTPLLVPPEEVARLISSPERVVDELIKEGHFGTRTIAGRRLVRYADVLQFVTRDDPEPVNWPPQEARQ